VTAAARHKKTGWTQGPAGYFESPRRYGAFVPITPCTGALGMPFAALGPVAVGFEFGPLMVGLFGLIGWLGPLGIAGAVG